MRLVVLVSIRQDQELEIARMASATIISFDGGITARQSNNGTTRRYLQGEPIEEPPDWNADLYWPSWAAKKYFVTYLGDSLPNVLAVRDGGPTGFHAWRVVELDAGWHFCWDWMNC
jgi:hypothetical protein